MPLWLLAWVSVELSWCIRLLFAWIDISLRLLWPLSLWVGEGWILIAHVVLLCVCALILTRLFLSIPIKLAHLITSFLSCFTSSLIMSCYESMAKLLQNIRVWKIPLS